MVEASMRGRAGARTPSFRGQSYEIGVLLLGHDGVIGDWKDWNGGLRAATAAPTSFVVVATSVRGDCGYLLAQVTCWSRKAGSLILFHTPLTTVTISPRGIALPLGLLKESPTI